MKQAGETTPTPGSFEHYFSLVQEPAYRCAMKDIEEAKAANPEFTGQYIPFRGNVEALTEYHAHRLAGMLVALDPLKLRPEI